MVRFTATKDGIPMFGFGLSKENVKRLKEGKPIHIDLGEMGGTGKVMIFYGRTEHDMQKELAEFIGPDTVYSADP